MRFSLIQMLIAVAVVALLAFVASMPHRHRQQKIADGIRCANKDWPTSAVIYEWPRTYDTSTGIIISSHVDRESGLLIQTRGKSEFRDAYNKEIDRLLAVDGPPQYSLHEALPAKAEIHRMFTAGRMETINQFPHQLTKTIKLKFDAGLDIETKGGSLRVDYDLPVYVSRDESLVYVKLGSTWMGVYLPDGRLLFEVR